MQNLMLSKKELEYRESEKKMKVNPMQDLFCKTFATDPTVIGNASRAYMKVYKTSVIENARTMSSKLMENPKITARINEYLVNEGFNDVSVDKKHNFLIHQHKDFNVSLKAIQEYNKLKKRVNNTIELIIPKPITELGEDEVIHKIDKNNVRQIVPENTETPI